jgi:hypothetical protein
MSFESGFWRILYIKNRRSWLKNYNYKHKYLKKKMSAHMQRSDEFVQKFKFRFTTTSISTLRKNMSAHCMHG